MQFFINANNNIPYYQNIFKDYGFNLYGDLQRTKKNPYFNKQIIKHHLLIT